MSLSPHYSEAQRQLVSARGGDDLIRIFDDLVSILGPNDEIPATIEFCSDALRRADELALTTDEWLNVAMSLIEVLRRTGLIQQAIQLADQIHARIATATKPSRITADALSRIAVVATNADDITRAKSLLDEAASHVSSANDLRSLALFCFSRGVFNLRIRRIDSAVSDFDASASTYSLIGERTSHAMAIGQKARAQMVAGHLRLARESFDSIISISSVPSRSWITIATNYAICLMYCGEWQYAEELLSKAERDAQQLGIHRDEWRVGTIRSLIASRRGISEDTINMAQIAAEQAKKSGRVRDYIAALECLGEAEYERGNAEAAIRIYADCIERGEAVGISDATSEGKRREAEAWIALGDYDKALAAATRSIEVSSKIEDRYEYAVAHRPLAIAYSMLGRTDEASNSFRHGIVEMRALGDPMQLAKTLVEFANHLREWDPTTLALTAASEYLREARELFTKLGVERWIKRTDDDLAEVIRLAEPESSQGTATSPDSTDSKDKQNVAEPDPSRSSRTFGSVTFLTRSPDIHAMLERLIRVAPSNLPVLITGESGTGKELIAHAILELGNRPKDRFVAINCAALPRELHESELFGHARGSFTGATAEKPGLFEMGDGGTIFLDEIGDLELSAQGKLLRILENGELRRVGEVKVRRVDARVVAATNRNLEQCAREGTFRGDLFHRLNGFPVRISSLRERPGDIEILANHFIDFFQREYKKRITMPPEILDLYRSYRWPGNVRELRQEIHRMVLLTENGTAMKASDSEVTRLAAVDAGSALAGASGLATAVEDHERRLIIDALQKTGGNKANAARLLNMSRTTLVGKVRRLGIE